MYSIQFTHSVSIISLNKILFCARIYFRSHVVEVSRSHSGTAKSLGLLSGRVIGALQRPLPDNTHTQHSQETDMLPMGFEPAIPASDRPQTHALETARPPGSG